MNYQQITELSPEYIKSKFNEFMEEDIPENDVTSKAIFEKTDSTTAVLVAKQDLVLSGLCILEHIFSPKTEIKFYKSDGDIAMEGENIAVIRGLSWDILQKERVMLNLIQRLSGIATLTKQYVQLAEPFSVKILDTRKTTPGLRLFEKYAVHCGGGSNHRLDLSSGILIKDNHIKAAGSITKAVTSSKQDSTLPIELEVDTMEQIQEGLDVGVDGFLLDNMSPEITKKAVSLIRQSINGYGIFIESSGGITLETLTTYLESGVNAISIGALTHSAKAVDISLDID